MCVVSASDCFGFCLLGIFLVLAGLVGAHHKRHHEGRAII